MRALSHSLSHTHTQWYAQDSLAASTTSLFNLSIVPGNTSTTIDPNVLNNSPDNFLLYHVLGNTGFIAYVGGGVEVDELVPGLTQACEFMGTADDVANVFLLGHWNDPSSGGWVGECVCEGGCD